MIVLALSYEGFGRAGAAACACALLATVAIVGLTIGCSAEDSPLALPARVDHLVFGVADLDAGVEYIEQQLGVRPVAGGRHSRYGTHNALVSLGATTYLEIIAPDPELSRPTRGRLFGLDSLQEPRLVTWAVLSEEIDSAASAAAAAGVAIGPVESGSRERPDGTVLTWKLSDPYAMPLEGAIPFLISWGETPHPASSAPGGASLVGLRIEHPAPGGVREALAALGITMDVRRGDEFHLVATIQTTSGLVELR